MSICVITQDIKPSGDKTDIISTVVSRAQSFFIPAAIEEESNYEIVDNFISNYWTINRNQVLEFETNLMNLKMKLKKASKNTYQILDKSDKVIFTFTNEDFKILSNSQIGCAIVYY